MNENETDQEIQDRLARLRAQPSGDAAPVLAAGRRSLRRRQAAGGLAAVVLLSGFGAVALAQPWQDDTTLVEVLDGTPPDSSPKPSPSSTPGATELKKGAPDLSRQMALAALWADFPVDAKPRPIVLLSDYAGIENPSFPTDELAAAFYGGRWDIEAALPTNPDTVQGYPMISAQAALDRLRPKPNDKWKGDERVTLTRIALATATFYTDRGEVELPAWRFTFAEANYNTGAVLAVDEPAWYRAEPSRLPIEAPYAEYVELSADGRSMTVHFTGAEPGSGPCQAEYWSSIGGTPKAVIITLHTTPGAVPSGRNVGCRGGGYARTLNVPLGNPVGARVVITDSGRVVEQRR